MTDDITGIVTQNGSVLQIEAHKTCQLRTHSQIETTEHLESVNSTGSLDWYLGASGAALLALGGGIYVDSDNVNPHDKTSRTYNSVGPDAAAGIGIGTMALGGVLLGIAVVDVIRAQGSKETASVATVKGEVAAGKCPSRPASGLDIRGEFTHRSMRSLSLGSTDSNGKLTINLAELSPELPTEDTGSESFNSPISIFVKTSKIGTARMSDALAVWRGQWRREREKLAGERAEVAAQEAQVERDREERQAQTAAVTAKEDAAKAAVVEWFGRNVVISSESDSMVVRERCVNQVDYEVPCDSAAAVRRAPIVAAINVKFVTNRARIPVTCNNTLIPPGKEWHPRDIFLAFLLTCTIDDAIRRSARIDEASLTGLKAMFNFAERRWTIFRPASR